MVEIGIGKDRYLELLEKEAKLEALETTGVDNWEGYGIAMTEYYQPLNEEEYKDD